MNAIYITNNSFSVSGNRTLEFVADRRVKATHSDSTQYCTIYGSTVSGSYTIVTLKENELTSNLASVLYGIIEPGISGSLPDHTHDGTEGSGGTISGGGSSDVQTLYEGVQSCRVLYATASGVYVNPGKVEINSTLYKVTSQVTKQLTSLTASNWYYIYAKPPSSGKIISSAEIEYTTTAPTENLAKMGYYHGTNTTWRCIGVVYASATDTVFEFDTERGFYRYYEHFLNYSTTITTSWVTVTFTAPAFAKFIQATFRALTYNVNGHIRYRHYGSSGKHFVLEYNSAGRAGYNTSLVKCDSSQRGQVYCSGAGTNSLYIYANGFMLPDSIYTGV